MTVAIANVLVGLVAAIQAGFALVEMLLWNRPAIHGRLAFDATEAARASGIVANAGLGNGFLAAGLAWGLLLGAEGHRVRGFFLACVLVAGIFGAATLSPNTLALQALPAALALIAERTSRKPGAI